MVDSATGVVRVESRPIPSLGSCNNEDTNYQQSLGKGGRWSHKDKALLSSSLPVT